MKMAAEAGYMPAPDSAPEGPGPLWRKARGGVMKMGVGRAQTPRASALSGHSFERGLAEGSEEVDDGSAHTGLCSLVVKT